MSWSLWLVYLGVITLIIGVPGPSALICMTHGVQHGGRRTVMTVLGGMSASFTLMSISAAGLGAIILASHTAFAVIKYAGAAYLIWLGISAWRDRGVMAMPQADSASASMSLWKLYTTGYKIGISNPKDLVFFGSLFPHFIDPAQGQLAQFAVLAATWVVVDFGAMSTYAMLGHRVSPWLGRQRNLMIFRKLSGSFFVAAGSALMVADR
ncbi:LysE family translocator [Silvimonas sp. JCM 19000]